MRPRFVLALVAGLAATSIAPAQHPDDAEIMPNVGHTRHYHRHNAPHKTTEDASRFHTSREGAKLVLPVEEDAFTFAVFGDRTGGPATGVSVLADAVRDVNLIEPDLVMTVGDLINGYNEKPQWMEQMREYKSIMDKLLCPWFPVAGNHDTYWRGPDGQRPKFEHDPNYEMHFGPLWYAVEHKNCFFIALYSDEGDPETGEKNFRDPTKQRMSPEQYNWLKATLSKARNADHVFLFLHHPRWLGGRYGDDWNRVHQLLVEAGNVSAVFAGHIHRFNYRKTDDIEYVTLATVGGGQGGEVPSIGQLHHFNLVTVRKDQVAIAAIPVGEVMDPREIDEETQNEVWALARQKPEMSSTIDLASDGTGTGEVSVTYKNTSSRPIEVTVVPESKDSRWFITPDHSHATIKPGESHRLRFRADRPLKSLDRAFHPLTVATTVHYLAPGYRYEIPTKTWDVDVDVDLPAPTRPSLEQVLNVDGSRGHALVMSDQIPLPDGPMTLECWFKADRFSRRTGLVAKTEGSDYGFFVNRGRPGFSIHVGGSYKNANGENGQLKTDTWYHIAGVFDGETVAIYVNGELVERNPASGARRTNALPLIIGADVNRSGKATSHFDGLIDSVRLSKVARYTSERFTPDRRFTADDDTLLLLNMDGPVGPWLYDESPNGAHAVYQSGASMQTLN